MKLTIVIRRVLVSRAREFDECEIREHFAPPSAVHHPAGRDEGHSREHREDLVRGRVDRQDDNSTSCGPLSQVLDQKERVEYVHALGGLVQQHKISVQKQMGSDVETPPLRHRQPADAGVAHRLQSEIRNQRIDLQNASNLYK